jgi:hypothetical protein
MAIQYQVPASYQSQLLIIFVIRPNPIRIEPMSKMSREEKLFRRENTILDQYKELSQSDPTPEQTREGLARLVSKYEDLLLQTRFMTWVSGRLERKLQRTNRELVMNNHTLQATLDELTRSEASRSAYTIIYFIAIVLFVLEEYLVEPLITQVGGSIGYGLLIKGLIVVLLKVIEGVIEKKVTRNRRILVKQKK